MVRAHYFTGGTFTFVQTHRAVFANVVKRAQLVLLVANDQYRVTGNFGADIGAVFAQFFCMANPLPGFTDDGV